MKNPVKLIIIAGFAIFGVGCQEQKSVNPQTGPVPLPIDRTTQFPPGTTPVVPDEPLSECNGFQVGTSGMAGKAKAYYSAGGTYDSNKIRVKISQLPSTYVSGEKSYFDFYRWKVSQTGGDIYIDPTPMTYDLIYKKTGAIVGTFGLNKFDNVAFLNIQTDSSTTSDINDFEIEVRGTAQEYQVIRVAVKKSVGSASDQILSEIDFLIPAFTANPKAYTSSHNATLSQLHPLNSKVGQSWSSAEFKSIADATYCF